MISPRIRNGARMLGPPLVALTPGSAAAPLRVCAPGAASHPTSGGAERRRLPVARRHRGSVDWSRHYGSEGGPATRARTSTRYFSEKSGSSSLADAVAGSVRNVNDSRT